MRIEKYEATGNDFLLVGADDAVSYLTNCRTGALRPECVQQLCDRHYGLGGDGLMVVKNLSRFSTSSTGEYARGRSLVEVRYYNSDGTEADFCGNGARCVARYAQRHGWLQPQEYHGRVVLQGVLRFQSQCYPLAIRYGDRVLVGLPWEDKYSEVVSVPQVGEVVLLNTGVWHAVVCCKPGELDARFEAEAGKLRHEVNTSLGGANVDYYEVLREDSTSREIQVRMRTFEMGVEGETLSCGSGAVAVARACARGAELTNWRYGKVRLEVPGGELQVHPAAFDPELDAWERSVKLNRFNLECYLAGPARFVYSTEWGSF